MRKQKHRKVASLSLRSLRQCLTAACRSVGQTFFSPDARGMVTSINQVKAPKNNAPPSTSARSWAVASLPDQNRSSRHFGRVKAFNQTNGHGSIEQEKGVGEVQFYRRAAMWRRSVDPAIGQPVSFEVDNAHGRAVAVKLRMLDGRPAVTAGLAGQMAAAWIPNAGRKAFEHDQPRLI